MYEPQIVSGKPDMPPTNSLSSWIVPQIGQPVVSDHRPSRQNETCFSNTSGSALTTFMLILTADVTAEIIAQRQKLSASLTRMIRPTSVAKKPRLSLMPVLLLALRLISGASGDDMHSIPMRGVVSPAL